MKQIVLEEISKHFKVYQRPSGKWGLLRGAFQREVRVVQALDRIGFSIAQGELVGYIGPNGAGKSTSVKVMSGILTPDRGNCTICGRVPWQEREAHVAQIGVVFGQRSQLWWDVPVADSFNLLRDIYAIPSRRFAERRDELVKALGTEQLLRTPARQLSLGQRMRCELVAALLHRPKVLFLDEPTIGLDAISKLALRDFLKQENKQSGVTILLTTHDMDDIEALCERVMVVGHGKLLYDGALTELKARYARQSCLKVFLASQATMHPEALPQDLAHLPGVERVEVEGLTVRVYFLPGKIPRHRLIAALADRLPVEDIEIVEPDIDRIIAAMYRDLAL